MAGFLVAKDGVPDAVAAFAARASQGHIGRARALARDEGTRNRRREVVALPAGLTSLGACMNAAANLVDIAKDETEAITESSNARELAELEATYGDDRKAKRVPRLPGGAQGADLRARSSGRSGARWTSSTGA